MFLYVFNDFVKVFKLGRVGDSIVIFPTYGLEMDDLFLLLLTFISIFDNCSQFESSLN